MTLVYPVADSAEAALHAPRGFAERAREAELLAMGEVRFVTEPVGPAFTSREALLEAYPGADTPGWRQMAAVTGEGGAARLKPVRPVYSGGRRWPEPTGEAAPVFWRLSVSYWRLGGDAAAQAPLGPARKLRRGRGGEGLGGMELNALARQPLRAVRPQQPLDLGLFEVRRPEAPEDVIPDE
jgi:hypothetical protein